MIWFLSDPHGGQDMDGFDNYLSFCKEDDLLIVLGDMELHFRDTDMNREFTAFFEKLPCQIAFIDGNHENFDHLYDLPEEDWCGGRVHRLSPMGGCKSTQKWKDSGLWWPQEEPTADEIALGYENLKKHGNQVDYILTHKHRVENPEADPMTLQGLTNFIEENVTYQHWYSGHWHKTVFPDDRHTVVFQEPIALK